MELRVNPKDIKWAMVIIDPADEECRVVQKALLKEGVKLDSIQNLGPKCEGHNVELALSGAAEKNIMFAADLTPPVLVVSYCLLDKSLKVAVFEGKTAIACGLEIDIPRR